MNKKLIEALEKERAVFESNGHSTLEHDRAITYLKTGIICKNINDNELLYVIINDFDCVCSDYGVTKLPTK